jgi:hypothetical protein
MDLAEFSRWCVQDGPFCGCDLDGGSVQAKASEYGIIQREPYDPAKHGDNDVGADPGD